MAERMSPDLERDQVLVANERQRQIALLEKLINFIESSREAQDLRRSIGTFAFAAASNGKLRKELIDEIAKLYLDTALHIVRSAHPGSDEPNRLWSIINHTPCQAGYFYYTYYSVPMNDPVYDDLGEELVKLLANRYTAEYRNEDARPIYQRLGLKPSPNKSQQNPDGDVPLFIQGVKEFQINSKKFPLIDDKRWLERLKTVHTQLSDEIKGLTNDPEINLTNP